MFPIPYSRLVVYAVVSVATSFLVTTFRVSIWILDGIHTYIHPENVGNGSQGNVRAAIRRPGTDMNGQDANSTMASGNRDAVDNSTSNEDEKEIGSMGSGENQAKVKGKLKERPKRDVPKGYRWKKEKLKEKFSFDETNAQMFRLRLGDSQLQSRQYFTDYDEAIIYASLGLCNLLTHQFLPEWSSSDDKQSTVMFFQGDLVPFLVGLYAIYKLARLLGRMSLEKSASKNSEQLLSIFVGLLGFLVSLTILSVFAPGSVDLRIGSTSTAESKKNEGNQVTFLFGFMKFFLAIFAGWLCGLLFSPAHKAVRSFWLGTDQLQWNLSVIGSGKLTRTLFYLNIVMPVFTSLLWIKPMADIFILQSNGHQRFTSGRSRSFPSDLGVQKIQVEVTGTLEDPGHQENMVACMETKGDLEASAPLFSHYEHNLCQRKNGEISGSMKSQNPSLGSSDFDIVYGEGEDTKWYFWRRFYSSYQENWTRQIGMPAEVFEQFRVWCLLCTAVLQLLLMRPNLQMYLNEAVLIWYQRLHGSRDPNLDFSRAKLFLHNYFICQVALQFFIPGTLVLLFLGLSQIRGSISGGLSLPGSFLFSSSFFQEAALFMAWWVQSVWAVLTCSNLALYRLGFLTVS